MNIRDSIDRLTAATDRLSNIINGQSHQMGLLERSLASVAHLIPALITALGRQVGGRSPSGTPAARTTAGQSSIPHVSTLSDYLRATQSVYGAIVSMIRALEHRNERIGVRPSVPMSLLSGAAGEGYLATVARYAIAKSEGARGKVQNFKKRMASRSTRLRAKAAKYFTQAAGARHKANLHRVNLQPGKAAAAEAQAAAFMRKGANANSLAGKASAAAAGAEVSGAAVVGRLAGPIGLAVTAIFKFRDAVDAATDSQIEAMRKYEHLSGPMAAVLAMRDIQEMQRDIEKGNRLASSTRSLTAAEQSRKEGTKEIDILADRLQNYALAGANKIIEALLAPLEAASEGVNKLIDFVGQIPGLESDKDMPVGISDWVKQEEEMGTKIIKDNVRKVAEEAARNRARRG